MIYDFWLLVYYRLVVLDDVLSSVCIKKGEDAEYLMWDVIMSTIMSKMSPAYSVTLPGEPTLYKKGNLPNITIAVNTRSGNKKVTLWKSKF